MKYVIIFGDLVNGIKSAHDPFDTLILADNWG
jgi:hypothetical protein